MFDNLHLRRSKKQFQQSSLIDTTLREDPNKSSFIMLQKPREEKLASPLLNNFIEYPKKLHDVISLHKVFITGYAEEVFWVVIEKVLYIWSYIEVQQNAIFDTKADPQVMVFQFPQKISALNYLKSSVVSFVHKKLVGIFVIAFESYIQLFVFQDQKLSSLNIKVKTQESIQHVIGDVKGNIYYVGDKGIVRQLRNQSEKRTRFKNINGMNLFTRITHNFNLAKIDIAVKRVVINQKRNRLHCLVIKKYKRPWMLKFINKQEQTQVIDVETYVLDPLEYHHRFNNQQFYKQLLLTNSQYSTRNKNMLKIVDLFITNQSLLGLVLLDGTFIKLINTRIMTIGTLDRLPSIPKANLLFEMLSPSQFSDQYQTIDSLGEGSLSEFVVRQRNNRLNSMFSSFQERSLTAFINEGSFDYNFKVSEMKLSTFKRDKVGINKFLQNTIFASSKQFISFTNNGMMSYKKLTPLQILVSLLNIHYECIVYSKQNQENFGLLELYSSMNSVVLMCTYLIQIICARNIQVTLPSSIILNTKLAYFTFSSPSEKEQITSNRIYTNSPPVRKLAEKILTKFECKIITVQKYNPGQVFERNLQDTLNQKTDVLWNCLTHYFNQLFFLIKPLNMRIILKQKGLVYYIKEKLNIFERFLKKKLSTQVDIGYRLQGNYSRFILNRAEEQLPTVCNTQERLIPQDLTSNLIIRLTNNIQRMLALINAFEVSEGEYPEDLKIQDILTNQSVRQRFADIFFKNIARQHPIALQLVNKMPQLMVYLNKPNLGDSRAYANNDSVSPFQILIDLRKLFESYRMAEQQHYRFHQYLNRNEFGDVFDRADSDQMKRLLSKNQACMKLNQQTFEAIFTKLITESKYTQNRQWNQMFQQALVEIRNSKIGVYIGIANHLLHKRGMQAERDFLNQKYPMNLEQPQVTSTESFINSRDGTQSIFRLN